MVFGKNFVSCIKFTFSTDICTKFMNLCSQICEATDDSYVCKCEKGYKLIDDKKTCVKEDDEASAEKLNEVTNNPTEYELYFARFKWIFMIFLNAQHKLYSQGLSSWLCKK